MSEQRFPPGWDAERVKRVLEHYEGLSEEHQAAEDEEAREQAGQALIAVPEELLPALRQLLATYRGVEPSSRRTGRAVTRLDIESR